MKMINLLRYNWLAVIIILIFTQCNDISNDIGSESDLIGTWVFSSAKTEFISGNSSLEEDLKENGFSNDEIKEIIKDLEDEFIDEEFIIRFSEDNVFSIRNDGFMEELGTWEVNESKIKINYFSNSSPSEYLILYLDARQLRVIITESKLLEVEKDLESFLFGRIESEIDYTFTKAFE